MSEGQAPAVHVRELVSALRRRGFDGVAINRDRAVRSRFVGYVSVVWRALRQTRRVDLLYVRSHPAGLPLVAIAHWCARVQIIVEVNGTAADMTDAYPWTRLAGMFLEALDRALLSMADGVVAVSPGLRDWVHSQASTVPTAVIPNAADPRRFHPDVESRPGLPHRYVAYCGALAPWQGLDTLLGATTDPRWPRGVRLIVAGEGPLRSEVARARSSGAPIDDLGVLAHDDIPAVLVGALAVVSTRSHRDASPMKLYEALACGVPVVASAVPGQVELVESRGCGLTFLPGHAEDLAGAVAALAEKPALRARLATAALAAGQENSWDARAQALIDFIRVINGPVRESDEAGWDGR